ncbi:MAG: methyltransferase domain-containing protein, partial [Armatimonadetes bacterium]|nr:methyltransferase domain-containing protein [Armatimonadota bacterium]
TVDIVVSAYAIHHLDDGAKAQAACEAHRVLRPRGAFVVADTMFRDEAHKAEALRAHADLEDEYQPLLTTLPLLVEQAGFVDVRLHQPGELVWVLAGRRGPI